VFSFAARAVRIARDSAALSRIIPAFAEKSAKNRTLASRVMHGSRKTLSAQVNKTSFHQTIAPSGSFRGGGGRESKSSPADLGRLVRGRLAWFATATAVAVATAFRWADPEIRFPVFGSIVGI
jgi:hypothetical protein